MDPIKFRTSLLATDKLAAMQLSFYMLAEELRRKTPSPVTHEGMFPAQHVTTLHVQRAGQKEAFELLAAVAARAATDPAFIAMLQGATRNNLAANSAPQGTPPGAD